MGACKLPLTTVTMALAYILMYVCAVCACFAIYELLYLIFKTIDLCVRAKLILWELYYHSLLLANQFALKLFAVKHKYLYSGINQKYYEWGESFDHSKVLLCGIQMSWWWDTDKIIYNISYILYLNTVYPCPVGI